MSTRNLTIVYHQGKYLISKYCQYDGYPSSKGVEILEFLRKDFNRDLLLEGLSKHQPATKEDIERAYEGLGIWVAGGYVTSIEGRLFEKSFPYLDTSTGGAGLLEDIQRGIVSSTPVDLDFAADSVFCEWGYCLDLDLNTYEVYKGFNTTPLTETDRFFHLESLSRTSSSDGTVYHPIRCVGSFPLQNLPTSNDFLNIVDPRGEY